MVRRRRFGVMICLSSRPSDRCGYLVLTVVKRGWRLWSSPRRAASPCLLDVVLLLDSLEFGLTPGEVGLGGLARWHVIQDWRLTGRGRKRKEEKKGIAVDQPSCEFD